jgi:hypothetical protein
VNSLQRFRSNARHVRIEELRAEAESGSFKRKWSVLLWIAISPCLNVYVIGGFSVKVAATQKEAAGLADHFAARVAHL